MRKAETKNKLVSYLAGEFLAQKLISYFINQASKLVIPAAAQRRAGHQVKL
jgi:hypothetical protein